MIAKRKIRSTFIKFYCLQTVVKEWIQFIPLLSFHGQIHAHGFFFLPAHSWIHIKLIFKWELPPFDHSLAVTQISRATAAAHSLNCCWPKTTRKAQSSLSFHAASSQNCGKNRLLHEKNLLSAFKPLPLMLYFVSILLFVWINSLWILPVQHFSQ